MDSVLRFRIWPVLICALAFVALAVPALAQAQDQAQLPKGRTEGVTVTRYLMGRVKPTPNARGAAYLWTNTGFSNRRAVYPVLARTTTENGSEWIQVRALRNRTQVDVWIPRWATRSVWIDWRINIDVSSRKATIYRMGKAVRRFRVVVGARKTPTPTGTYYVVDRLRLRNSWARGKWALATSAFSQVLKRFDGGIGQIALHARGSLTAPLGTAASNGCIRFDNAQIAWVARQVPNGTPIEIQK